MVFGPSVAWAGGCDKPSSSLDLSGAVQRAETAWKEMNDASLNEALQDASTALECIDEVVSSKDVAAFFRAQALGHFLIGDTERALRALWTAKLTQPTYQFPESMAGVDHPLVRMYETVAYRPSEATVPLLAPESGSFFVNGGEDSNPGFAAGGRPYVFQQVDEAGGVVQTIAVPAGGRPSYSARVGAKEVLVEDDDSVAVQAQTVAAKRASRGLLVASLAAGVGSVAALAAAGSLRSQYNNAGVEQGTLDGVIRANRAVGVTGVSLGASSLGLGVGAVLVGRW